MFQSITALLFNYYSPLLSATNVDGIDIKYFQADNAAACCSACSYDTGQNGCAAWSYNIPPKGDGRCYLKTTSKGGASSQSDVVSGIVIGRPVTTLSAVMAWSMVQLERETLCLAL